jgi:hypothetical protein
MKAIKTLQTNAKNIKKFLKLSGVNVLSCKQNGLAVIVAVSNTPENVSKALRFFSEFGLTRRDGSAINSNGVARTSDFVDFGNLFRTEIC